MSITLNRDVVAIYREPKPVVARQWFAGVTTIDGVECVTLDPRSSGFVHFVDNRLGMYERIKTERNRLVNTELDKADSNPNDDIAEPVQKRKGYQSKRRILRQR